MLRNMPELEELSLYRTKVTNAGLARLSGLKNLRLVDLRYSRVTSSGVRDMAAALPTAEVLVLESSNASRPRKGCIRGAGQGELAIAEWLRSVGAKVQMTEDHVIAVCAQRTTITDRELEILTKLPRLASLSPQHTEVSRSG